MYRYIRRYLQERTWILVAFVIGRKKRREKRKNIRHILKKNSINLTNIHDISNHRHASMIFLLVLNLPRIATSAGYEFFSLSRTCTIILIPGASSIFNNNRINLKRTSIRAFIKQINIPLLTELM